MLISLQLEHVKDSIKSSELIEQIPSEADLTQNRSFSEKTTEKSGNNDERKPESSFIAPFNGAAKLATRKRKRSDGDDDLEGRYLSRLAREEANKNQEHPRAAHTKRQKQDKITVSTDVDVQPEVENESTSDMCIATGQRNEDSIGDTAQHESIVTSREDLDLEKSSRTVFLANVSTSAIKSKRAKKELLDHLVSFASSLPLQHAKPVIESLRFRSTAFVDTGVPKKVSFAKKELMDTTTKSTNAYAVYTTQSMAKEAAKRLNGTMLLGRHIRVDLVAHPAKIDHRRCVFVGNLGFVDDETKVQAAKDEETKKRPRNAKDATDVEEGLWRQFKKAGTVESVRVVRDKKTRVGKGIAYVQFEVRGLVVKDAGSHR